VLPQPDIPEWLLKEWGMNVETEFGRAA
jgi:hypothetical protein